MELDLDELREQNRMRRSGMVALDGSPPVCSTRSTLSLPG
jgi:hypothetical protein